jgi:hypothetical protein
MTFPEIHELGTGLLASADSSNRRRSGLLLNDLPGRQSGASAVNEVVA